MGESEERITASDPEVLGAMLGTLVASVLLLAAPATIDLDGDVPWVVAGSQVRPAPPLRPHR